MIALYYVQGLSSREIGEVLEVPTSTVTSRLHRARTILRTELERMRAPDEVRRSLLGNLETWARSLAPLVDLPLPTA